MTSETMLFGAFTFLVGLALRLIDRVGDFAAKVAALESQTARVIKDVGKVEERLSELDRDLNGLGNNLRDELEDLRTRAGA